VAGSDAKGGLTRSYNPPAMLDALTAAVAPAMLERATLLLNHVVSSEPAAMERLLPHAGRRIVLDWDEWPSLVPRLPPLALRVSAAGLFERLAEADAADAPDLRLGLDAGNPLALGALLLGGERPTLSVQGDSALAADMAWLTENLRWDVEDDLAGLIGDVPARTLGQIGRTVAGQLAGVVRTMGAWRGGRDRGAQG
jgi:ubiquinone biosynthesis protein UbiJ